MLTDVPAFGLLLQGVQVSQFRRMYGLKVEQVYVGFKKSHGLRLGI